MGFELTAADYAEYIRRAYKKINENGDYVTELDLATGDGDHTGEYSGSYREF